MADACSLHTPNLPRWRPAFWVMVAACLLAGCAPFQSYRPDVPPLSCSSKLVAGVCTTSSTEVDKNYTLHVAEFDDQGWLYRNDRGGKDQIDSAIDQIQATLKGSDDCVRVIVFVHGWHHNAAYDDKNMQSFRKFLWAIGDSAGKVPEGADACEDADTARTRIRTTSVPPGAPAAEAAPPPPKPGRKARIVGIYVGWRGDSFAPETPLDVASFWDRKSTADRVAQGSVRELFGRLNVLARPAAKAERRLRVYVIGHSFGASVAFRALSQTVLNGFADGIDAPDGYASRYVDMVVLLNPAIEASRFDPIYRTARKHQAYCERKADPAGAACDRPPYQAPLLAIFTAGNDQATGRAFPFGATLGNFFQSVADTAELDAMRQTIGWNDAYQTHTLSMDPAACPAAKDEPFEPGPDGRPVYAAPGWRWCLDQALMVHAGAKPLVDGASPPYNGPLWNVRIHSKDIASGHNGIWDDDFRHVIEKLFKSEIVYGYRDDR